MSDADREKMAENAKAFAEEANKILQEAMASCQLEGFKGVELNIPADINSSVAKQPVSQEEIWQQINQLYNSQAHLFDGELIASDSPPDPGHTEQQE